MTTTCHRPDCDESFENDDSEIEQYLADRHVAEDHDDLREEVDNYPRHPEQR